MRNGKKLHSKESAKKTGGSTPRQAHKKSAPQTAAATAKHVELPVVAPPAPIASPLLFWPAVPFAMMRMWLGPRTAVGK
jgi:hypothetical protein